MDGQLSLFEAENMSPALTSDGKCISHKRDNYDDFVAKFEHKLTTDDCYTPDNIYNVVESSSSVSTVSTARHSVVPSTPVAIMSTRIMPARL